MAKRKHKKSKIVGESTLLPDEDTSEAAPLVVCLPNGFTIRQRSPYQHCNAIYETLD